jgi:alpha-D-ribose 1-methylphosphonate 5-triphosphate synthase subunit PhnG
MRTNEQKVWIGKGIKQGREEREAEILEMIDELLEESKRLKEYGWIDGVELKTNLQEKFK